MTTNSKDFQIRVFYCPYCREPRNSLIGDRCSRCLNLLSRKAEFFSEGKYNLSDYNWHEKEKKTVEKCKATVLEKKEKRAEKAENAVSEFLEKIQDLPVKKDVAFDSEAISGDGSALMDYLKALIQAESRVYEFRSVYCTVCDKLHVASEISEVEAEVVKDTIQKYLRSQKKKTLSQSKGKETSDESPEVLLERKLKDEGVIPPVKPVKPVLKAKPVTVPPVPEQPEYEKPGFFNKKKVVARNEAKERDYKEKLAAYENALKTSEKYEKKAKEYAAAVKEYEIEQEAYDQAFAEYEKKRLEAEKEIAIILEREKAEQDAAAKQERKLTTEKNKQLKADAFDALPNQRLLEFLTKQKKVLEEMLEEAAIIRNTLYGTGTIYLKYRTIVAEASFLEYLESGRCEKLAGESGAYNIYESEIRAGIITPLIEQLLLSIESIKLSQTVLYKALKDISGFVNNAVGKLEAFEKLKPNLANDKLVKQWLEEEENGRAGSLVTKDAEAKLQEFETLLKSRREAKDSDLKMLMAKVPKH